MNSPEIVAAAKARAKFCSNASSITPPTALEAALSESINVGGSLGSEDEAISIIGDYRSLLYTATDEGEDVAYYESGDEVQKMGFQELDRLGLAGGIVLRHYPLHAESLSEGDAEEVMKLLADLPRPTYIMCRSAGRASGVKAIYLGRMAGLKEESELLRNMQTEEEGAWRKHPRIKAWVLSSIAAPRSSSIGDEASETQEIES